MRWLSRGGAKQARKAQDAIAISKSETINDPLTH